MKFIQYRAPRLRTMFSYARGRGHLIPLLPLAASGRMANDETAVVGHPVHIEQLAQFSTKFAPYKASDTREGPGALLPVRPDDVYEKISQVFIGPEALQAAVEVGRAIRSWKPDIVFCDEVDFGAMCAAELEGIPYVVVGVFATVSQSWRERHYAALQRFRTALNLAEDPALTMLNGAAVILPFPECMRNGREFNTKVLRMRPEWFPGERASESARWLRGRSGTIRIYVTFGTEFNTRTGNLFRRIVSALDGMNVSVLVTTGPRVEPEDIVDNDGNNWLRVEKDIPQAEILKSVDLVICHAGSGTLVGALAHGVPLLMFPLGADQVPNARWIEESGCGASLNAESATDEEIRQCVLRIVFSDSVRRASQEVKESIHVLKPADEVYREVVEMCVYRQ